MAYKSILTDYYKVSQAQQDYYDPVALLPGANNEGITSLYAFLAKADPWDDDNNPPQPEQTQKYLKSIYPNIFVTKKIGSDTVKLVIERIDWTSGETYDYYRDDIDMTEKDSNGFLIQKFYIKNSYNQVFKCLWNNNGNPSTVEPYFQPGTYGADNIFIGSDGYKWKYMYVLDGRSIKDFLDSSWMPIPITLIPGLAYSGQTLDPTETGAGFGDIEVINVTNGGSGYDPANSTITVTVTGDGIGATAEAVVENGSINDIVVTNTGTNYTYANVSIISTLGSGATAIAPASPIGGHAYDSPSELGATHVMYSIEFNSDESGNIPTDINYNQLGLLYNPLSYTTYPYFANANIYKTTTDFVVSPGFGLYQNDEIVYQGESLDNNSFSAKILSFDPATNVIKLINTQGSYVLNLPVYGSVSGTTRTLLQVSTPDFIKYSGYLAYIENRSSITRSTDGIEQFKFVLGY